MPILKKRHIYNIFLILQRFKNGFQPYPNAQCQLSHKNAPFFILHPLKVREIGKF